MNCVDILQSTFCSIRLGLRHSCLCKCHRACFLYRVPLWEPDRFRHLSRHRDNDVSNNQRFRPFNRTYIFDIKYAYSLVHIEVILTSELLAL